MRIDFDEENLLTRVQGGESTQGLAALTYVCFLTSVRVEIGDQDFGRDSVPLLGICEELKNRLDSVNDNGTAMLDWLGGGSPTLIRCEGDTLILEDGFHGMSATVSFDEYQRAVGDFIHKVFEFLNDRFPDLSSNQEFLDLKKQIMDIS